MANVNRLLVFAALIALLLGGAAVLDNVGPQASREAYRYMGKVLFTPFVIGVSESIDFGPLCAATLVMRHIENRKFSEYAVPLHLSLRKRFRAGCLAGPPAISRTDLGDGPAAFCYGHEL
jgi:hypothetical protein